MELDLSKEMPDNLGDILTMRFATDDGPYNRFINYMNRRDVPLNDKIRAWNEVRSKMGDLTNLVTTPNQIRELAKRYPSDC